MSFKLIKGLKSILGLITSTLGKLHTPKALSHCKQCFEYLYNHKRNEIAMSVYY